jgi:TRAP-type mannitol/chloroaromatic compound transport system permease large subunit
MTLAGLATSSAGSSQDVYTGVVCFLVIAAMSVALVFLFRSMNKQFKKIGSAPDPDAPNSQQ